MERLKLQPFCRHCASAAMPLRSALTRAAKSDTPIRQPGIELKSGRSTRFVNIEVVPFRMATGQGRFFLVVFTNAEGQVDTSLIAGGKESTTVRGQRERKEISKLKMDLLSTRGSLQSIIEEQETTNEELKSANEEIQSSNEEL